MSPSGNNLLRRVLASEEVDSSERERPVYFKQLGVYLVELREAQGWNQSEAAAHAERRGLKPLTRQIILRMERGQVKDPHPHVLKQLATLYKKDSADVLRMFLSEKYDIDLLGQSHTVRSPDIADTTGEIHALHAQLRAANTRYVALLKQLGKLSGGLWELATTAIADAEREGLSISIPDTVPRTRKRHTGR